MRLSVKKLFQKAGLPPLRPEQIAGHEDNVGENVLLPLLLSAGFDASEVKRKPPLTHAIVGESRCPDFGIHKYQEKPKPLFGVVADVKAAGEDLSRWEEKLAGYCGLAGAIYGILTNGNDLVVIRPKNGVVDWTYEDKIPTRNALVQRLQRKPTAYSEPHIIYATRITEEFNEGTVEALARHCHDIIRSRKGMTVPDRLYEFSKLLVTRIMDERHFAEGKQESLFLTEPALKDLEKRRVDLQGYIGRLFQSVKDDIGIFERTESIDLPLDVVRQMVELLDQFPLWSDEIDVLGQVYENFLIKTMTGQELGQYFTPRPIVRAVVEMVNPERGETVLDPACGSGGFLIGSLLHMKEKYDVHSPMDTKLLARPFRGADMLAEATKMCQINLFLHGDCHDNVFRADSLDPDSMPDFMLKALGDPVKHGFDCILTNPPFGAKEGTRLPEEWAKKLCGRWRKLGLRLYECAEKEGGFRNLQPQSPFVELCIKLLRKPRAPGGGGRLGIVIDNGLLSNTQREESVIRALIRNECIIEAIVGLPKGTFKPYGSNVIPDILILRRKHDKEEQGEIFRAEASRIGLVPGTGSYKEASDEDLRAVVKAWREWKGVPDGTN